MQLAKDGTCVGCGLSQEECTCVSDEVKEWGAANVMVNWQQMELVEGVIFPKPNVFVCPIGRISKRKIFWGSEEN